jgi:hypoxanthine phosphoribosyltransferase
VRLRDSGRASISCAVSSYGSGTKTSGVVKIIKDLDINLKGYDIVIVEDILDSGKTLHYLVNLLKSREPNSIEICTLFDKPERREVEVLREVHRAVRYSRRVHRGLRPRLR